MSDNHKRESTVQSRRGPGFGGGHGPMMMGPKAKDLKGTYRRLIQYLDVYRSRILLVIFLAIGSATFSIVGPKMLGRATTKIYEGLLGKVQGTGTGIDFNYIGNIILTLAILYTTSALL
ncbi:MAG TPA: multidrug ABC transporter ATP-binding protein, partial [Clostridiales bacterium UBA8960]|nr:multidrug ABC transporter ATP-binding protein [Clostridiales bacterium UBA8960]